MVIKRSLMFVKCRKKRRKIQSEERRVRKPSSNFNVFELIPVSILKHPSAWRCRINISFKIDLATSIYPFLFHVASKGERIFFFILLMIYFRSLVTSIWQWKNCFKTKNILYKMKLNDKWFPFTSLFLKYFWQIYYVS